ncbi:MAG: ATP-binding protein, partial [Bdellovibrionota bacterium]|nr:ATP-binding protein [Bdellovibrionota bacterium]
NITFNLKYENKGLPSPLILGASKIREILQNVFNNSLKISDEGGKINVHVSFNKVKEEPLSYDIIIEVIDETEGMDEEDCQNLFIPYLDTLNEEEKNQKVDHMGLYISKVLLLKIGSDLKIKSSLGKGNTYKIHLKSVLKGLSRGLIFSPATIILGLKNKNVLNDLIEQLKNQPFEFIFAKNGEELIKKAMKEKADLIIAENDLGIIDTLTVRKNLACLPKLKNIPFLIIKDELSNSMNKTQIESFDDVLLPPFQNEKLLETLAQFLKNEIIETEEEMIGGDSELKSFFSEAENDLKKYLERKKDVCSKDEWEYLKKLKEQIEYLIESKEMEFRTKMYDDFLSTISNIDGNELQNWFMGLMNFTESDDQNELKSFLVDSLLELEKSIKFPEK